MGSYIWRVRQKWGSGELLMPGVAVLVFNTEGKVLLGRRSDFDAWCHVGGGGEIGVTVEQLARDELREEAGLDDVGEVELFGVLSAREATFREYPDGDTMSCWSVLCAVRGVVAADVVPADDEHHEFGWFGLEDLPQPLFGECAHVLDAWRAYVQTGRPVLR